MPEIKEFIIPDNASIPELKALLKDGRAQGADMQTILAIVDKITAAEDRLALIAKTKNFKPTQAKLYFRCASEEEILKAVPDSDVFDDIEVQKIKKKATGNKRITTSEKELKDYQALKANGVTEIIYDTEKDRIVAKPGEATNAGTGEGSGGDPEIKETTGSDGDGETTKTAEEDKPEQPEANEA